MSPLLQTLESGVVSAAVIAVAALAFSLQFGVTNYVNFAYSEYLTFGALIAVSLNTGPMHLNFWLSLAGGGITTAILAVALDHVVLTPFVTRRPQLLFALVVTFALQLLINSLMTVIFGSNFFEYQQALPSIYNFGAVIVTNYDIAFFSISAAVILASHYLLNFTKTGRQMRAMADDSSLARACGLDVRRITRITWLITGLLAGIAGAILAAQVQTFDVNLGSNYIFLVFSAVILGGIGRPYGAMVGALVMGLAYSLSSLYLPGGLSPVVVIAILLVIMLVRPQGLLTTSGRASLDR